MRVVLALFVLCLEAFGHSSHLKLADTDPHYPDRNFINSFNAVRVRQPYYINAKHDLPYVFTRTDVPILMRWTGIIKSDTTFSSRPHQDFDFGDIYALWPLQKIPTQVGGDGFAQPTFSVSNIFIQLGAYAQLKEEKYFRVRGFFNGNFNAAYFGSRGRFILNFAYLDLLSQKHRILLGQYINPLGLYENFPHVIALSYGAPFIPTAVNPQLLYQFQEGHLLAQVCLYTQFLDSDNGPEENFTDRYTGFSLNYINNAIAPILNGRLAYEATCFEAGVSANVKRIVPRITTGPFLTPTHETVLSCVLMAYLIARTQHWSGKSQVLWGSNGTDLLMLGGYAIRATDSITHERTYSTLKMMSVWFEIEKTNPYNGIQPGIFIGYTKGLGASSGPLELLTTSQTAPNGAVSTLEYPVVYNLEHLTVTQQFQKSLHSLLRISPRVWVFLAEGVQLGIEAEISAAQFGYLNNFGQAINKLENANALRMVASMHYFF